MSVRVLSRNYKPTYVAGTKYDPKWSYIRQHCVGFWPFWERGSNTLENWAAPGLRPAITFGTATQWRDMMNGPGLDFDGTGNVSTLRQRLGAVGLFADTTERWTAVVRARVGTLTSSRTMLSRDLSNIGANITFALRFAITTGNPAIILRGGTANTLTIPGFVPTDWNTFWVVWDGTTATFYLNAAQSATTLTVGTAVEEAVQIRFGAGQGGGILRLVGAIDFAAVLDVPLSPAQIARWSTDLMAPWRPARRFGKGVASGSAVLSGTVLT